MKPKGFENGFIAGLAYSMEYLYSFHGETTLAQELLNESGYDIADILNANIDEEDKENLRELFIEIGK